MKKLLLLLIGIMLVGCQQGLEISGIEDIHVNMRVYGTREEIEQLPSSQQKAEENVVINKEYKEKIIDLLATIPDEYQENYLSDFIGRYMCIEDNGRLIRLNDRGDMYIDGKVVLCDEEIVKSVYQEICDLLDIDDYAIVDALFCLNGHVQGEAIEYYVEEDVDVSISQDMELNADMTSDEMFLKYDHLIDRTRDDRYSHGIQGYDICENSVSYDNYINENIKVIYNQSGTYGASEKVLFEKSIVRDGYAQMIDMKE